MFNEANADRPEATQRMAELTEMVIQQIRRLSELRDEGILTDEEFTSKKQELLARL
jgi:Short C-terminal domain